MNKIYIDPIDGRDHQEGSKTKPFKNHPFTSEFGGGYNHSAGTKFVFKGGVKHPFSGIVITSKFGGRTDQSDIYGVEEDWWHEGPKFTPPVLDAEGRKLSHFRENMVYIEGAKNIIFYGLTFRNWQWNDPVPTSITDGFAIRSTSPRNNISAFHCVAEDWKVNLANDARFGGFNGLTRAFGCEVKAPKHIDPQFIDDPNGRTSGCGFFGCDLVDRCKVVSTSQGMFSCKVVKNSHLLLVGNSFRKDTHENGIWAQNWAVVQNCIIEAFNEGVLTYLLPYWSGVGDRRILFFGNIIFDTNRDGTGSHHNPVVISNQKAPLDNQGEVYVFNNLLVRKGASIWYGTKKTNSQGELFSPLKRVVIANNFLLTDDNTGLLRNGDVARELIIDNNLPIPLEEAEAMGLTKDNLFDPTSYSPELVQKMMGRGTNMNNLMSLEGLRHALNTEQWEGLGDSFDPNESFEGYSRGEAWDIGPYKLAEPKPEPEPEPENPEPEDPPPDPEPEPPTEPDDPEEPSDPEPPGHGDDHPGKGKGKDDAPGQKKKQ